MSETKKITIANATVLSVSKGTWTKQGETTEREKSEIVFQNTDNLAEVVTATCFAALPADVVPQGKLTGVEIEQSEYKGTLSNRVRFGDKKPWGGGGGGGYRSSPEEMAFKKQEYYSKLISIGTSYVYQYQAGPLTAAEALKEGEILAEGFNAWAVKKLNG